MVCKLEDEVVFSVRVEGPGAERISHLVSKECIFSVGVNFGDVNGCEVVAEGANAGGNFLEM